MDRHDRSWPDPASSRRRTISLGEEPCSSNDVRHLKGFLAVFEERSITSVAQRLFVSQQTLSVTIKQLEEEVGVRLFVRQSHGVDVSDEARVLYPQARRLPPVESIDAAGRLQFAFAQ